MLRMTGSAGYSHKGRRYKQGPFMTMMICHKLTLMSSQSNHTRMALLPIERCIPPILLPAKHTVTGVKFVIFMILSPMMWAIDSISKALVEVLWTVCSQGHTSLWPMCPLFLYSQSSSANLTPGAVVLWMKISATIFTSCFLCFADPIGKGI